MLGELLARARDERVFSAAAWSVGTADGVLSRGVLGTQWWDGPPAGETSRWDLASVTKPVVGIVVAALAERGVLSLDDPLPRHLPSYADTDKAAITVRQLLLHTSGLPGGTPLWRTHDTRSSLLEAIRTTPLPVAPGTRVEYSSQGFILLGLIASAASGTPLDRLVADLVTTPAGLTGTGFGPVDNAVATEDCPWRGHVVRGQVHDENAVVLGGICGHAGLFAPLGDMERLGQVLAGGAAPLLKPATHAEMIACHTSDSGGGWHGRASTCPARRSAPRCSRIPTATRDSPAPVSGWSRPAGGTTCCSPTASTRPGPSDITAVRREFHNAAVRL